MLFAGQDTRTCSVSAAGDAADLNRWVRERELREADAYPLKLFREVMLNNRGSEVFKELDPHFSEFMKAFKKM